ncbi:unnamed protein product [Closterium sp. NIES-65]|nr:unnamed protein product [Closterium sp. NIES-65]
MYQVDWKPKEVFFKFRQRFMQYKLGANVELRRRLDPPQLSTTSLSPKAPVAPKHNPLSLWGFQRALGWWLGGGSRFLQYKLDTSVKLGCRLARPPPQLSTLSLSPKARAAARPPFFSHRQVNSANLKLVLKPNITDRKWKVIFEPQRGDIRFLTRKIPIMGLLNLQVCSAVQAGDIRFLTRKIPIMGLLNLQVCSAVICGAMQVVYGVVWPVVAVGEGIGHDFKHNATGWKWKLTSVSFSPLLSLPDHLISPLKPSPQPLSLSPCLPQVGIGHDFKHNATGWKWKLTSALNGNTPSEIRYKHNLPVCPGVDVRVGWNAEYVLPDMHGALGTGEPILGLNVGRLYASVERLEAIFTSID